MDESKIKIISNHNKEYILNILGSIYSFSENNYKHPIKPSDLEVIVTHTIKKRNIYYEIKLINSSFDAERDLNNLKTIDIDNKFEFPQKPTQKLNLNLSVHLKKNQIFQPNNFSFYIKDINNNEINEFKFSKNEKNVLFFYSRTCDTQILHSINNSINFIQQNAEIYEQFEKIYYILLINKNNEINDFINKINQKINYFKNSPHKYKLIFLKNNSEKNKPINIFDTEDFYFFIINSNQKIIILNHLTKFQKKVKKLINKENKKTKPDYSLLLSQLYYFYKNITNLPYLFIFESSYSIKLKINDDFFSIIPLKLLNFSARGEIRTKEYILLNNLIDELHFKKSMNNLEEIQTHDFDLPLENVTCMECLRKIRNDEGLYICGWCKFYYCIQCTEEKLHLHLDLENYRKSLIHQEHNLIYITSRNPDQLKNIDLNKLGKNLLFSVNQSQLTYEHKAICNGCECYLNRLNHKIRYLCLNCRPGRRVDGGYVDFCFECINAMRTNEIRRKEIEELSVLERDLIEGNKNISIHHSHLQHAYLTLPIAVNGDNYYEF